MSVLPLRVVVTGSECTGKSTLARRLASHLSAPLAGEFARRYADAHAAPLTAADVEPIARGQVAAEDAAAANARGIVVLDTDLVSTVVYARHYYGACPPWIEDLARTRLGGLYLLLHPDVPWIADGVRDRRGAREVLHAAFQDALSEFGARWADVRGDWDERWHTARLAVETLRSAR